MDSRLLYIKSSCFRIGKPVHALRSSDKHLLTVPRNSSTLVPYKDALRSSDKHLLIRTSSTLGDRAFSVAAPTLWNSLPLDIRCCDSLHSFKTLLKTHLYNKVYN